MSAEGSASGLQAVHWLLSSPHAAVVNWGTETVNTHSKFNNCVHSIKWCVSSKHSTVKREERKPTRCNNIDDLLSIMDVDY